MRITERIHALKIPFQLPVAPGKTLDRFVYAYLIYGDEISLIDSGVATSYPIIFDYIRESGGSPEDIASLILTHAHPDHIGSAKAIKDAAECVVAAHPNAKAWVEDVELQYRERPVPGFHSLVGGSVRIDRFLEDGERLDLGNSVLEVFHTPGHSKCSISLFCREDGVLFVGDVIPQKNGLPIYDDVATTVASIKRLKRIDGVRYALASWDDPKEGEDAYRMMEEGLDYLQRIHNGIRKLCDEKPIQDPMELCAEMVRDLGLPEIAVNPIIAGSFSSHLNILDREDLVND